VQREVSIISYVPDAHSSTRLLHRFTPLQIAVHCIRLDYPFFLLSHPTQIADLSEAPGVGDKKILRTLALNLGLTCSSSVVKRAIQFGTRVAKHTNVLYHGSNRKGKGDARI
jgi:hypothetical protein